MFQLKSSLLLFTSWGNKGGGGGIQTQTLKLPQILQSPITKKNDKFNDAQNTIQSFISTLNKLGKDDNDYKNSNLLMDFFDDDIVFTDTSFYKPVIGKNDLLRHFLLFQETDRSPLTIHSKRNVVIDEIAIELGKEDDSIKNKGNNDNEIYKVFVQYHLEGLNNIGDEVATILPDSTGMTLYSLCKGKINKVFDVLEPPSPKPGNSGLQLLKTVNDLLGNNNDTDIPIPESSLSQNANYVERYFDAWNRRDMKSAINFFSDDLIIADTQYPTAFQGKDELEKHLLNVANCMPRSFEFKVDDFVVMPLNNNAFTSGEKKIGIQWHVESEEKELLFTRGTSFYTTDKNGLIRRGVDIPEPAGIKSGAFSSIANKLKSEPIRFVPLTMWLAYMYIVFFSDGILPGANALALEQRTWEEVRDLSLNFFLVSPLLNLPFAPVVHPMLEGVFNLLLAWAALFAGFLSDERQNKPNLLPFGPIVVGMQFLTSTFLLPYLAFRSSEKNEIKETIFKEDIGSVQATISEWQPLGAFLGIVGTTSIAWAFLARPEFGDLNERFTSFLELLSIDRVGTSFLVDLVIFALFQGWFVDDDMKRRGVPSGEMETLKNIAKFIPFFGLAYYLTARPQLPSKEDL